MVNAKLKSMAGEGTRQKLHLHISSQILADMRRGVFKLGDKLPSQTELVDKYQVSVSTIRQALATLEHRELIRTEKGRGSFVSLQSGKARQSQKLRTLGLIFERTGKPDDIHEETQVLLAYSAVCRERGIRLVSAQTDFDAHLGGSKLIETFSDMRLDGVCVFLHHAIDAVPRIEVLGREFPAAVVFFPGPTYHYTMPIDTIDVDARVGVEQLMEHFLQLGHRRIGYVGVEIPPDPFLGKMTTMGRYETYRDCLVKAGIGLDLDLVVNHTYGQEPGPKTMQAVLKMIRAPRPATAIFAYSDWLARQLMHRLWQEGVRVPQDVSIAGFNDVAFARELIPSLTTVAHPFTRAAETTIQLMEDRLANRTRPIQKISIPNRLMVRESVAAVGGNMAQAMPGT
jgi:DNA-binding LacI/PurR family transcriptional regulator